MPRCEIGLGGNLGSVAATFRRALDLLTNSGMAVRAVSGLYRTSAIGDRAGDGFLNAAATIETDLAPLELLDRLQVIEARLGRTREVRWGPRTLDLDLLFYGDDSFVAPRLIVPHPACWYRRFVLDPLTEIAPDRIHPEKRLSVRALRERLLPCLLPVALAGRESRARSELIARLAPEFPRVQFLEWPAKSSDAARDTKIEPAFVFWLDRKRVKGDDAIEFLSLPLVPRMALPAAATSADDFIRYVLQSALDEPVIV